MLQRHRKTRAQSTIEFTAVILFILGALLVFQKYIVRGFNGRWKGVGDAMGQGRIYDPKQTTVCSYKTFFQGVDPVWFDQDCFDQTCGEADCLRSTKSPAACSACLTSCQSPDCGDPE